MHRSGTSTMSGILYHAGLDLGKSNMGGNPHNPKGFFENYEIMSFNERLLQKHKINWHNTTDLQETDYSRPEWAKERSNLATLILNEYQSGPSILIKDPRICLLLPFYIEVFIEQDIEPTFTIVSRNPHEIARSLEKRDHFPYLKSYFLCMDYVLRAEKKSRGFKRIFIDYKDILRDPLFALQVVLQNCIPGHISPNGYRSAIENYVEPALNHSDSSEIQRSTPEPLLVKKLYSCISAITLRDSNTDEIALLDQFSSDFYANFNAAIYPRISIILMGDDTPENIERSLTSIFNQDYPNIECLIIFNNSIEEIVRKYEYLSVVPITISSPDYTTKLRETVNHSSGKWKMLISGGTVFTDSNSVSDLVASMKIYPTTNPEDYIVRDINNRSIQFFD